MVNLCLDHLNVFWEAVLRSLLTEKLKLGNSLTFRLRARQVQYWGDGTKPSESSPFSP